MTDQEYFERRKPLSESFDSNNDSGDDGGYVTKKDLIIFSMKIEKLFDKLESTMLKRSDISDMMNNQIKEHKIECELCKKDFLTYDNCFVQWKICHAKHQEESAQQTTARLKRFKDYREFFVWAAFGAYIVFQALDWNKLYELLK